MSLDFDEGWLFFESRLVTLTESETVEITSRRSARDAQVKRRRICRLTGPIVRNNEDEETA